MLSPIVDEIAGENRAGVKVCKVNVDEQPELAAQFNVMSIPTLVVMKDGKEETQKLPLRVRPVDGQPSRWNVFDGMPPLK